jgi:signal transduction histidine kinase
MRDEQGRVVLLIPEGRDISERRRVERAWRNVVEGTSGTTGSALFGAVARHLALALGTRHALIGELVADGRALQTLAVWPRDAAHADRVQAMEGTPAQAVLAGRPVVHPSGVRQAYPADPLLAELGVDAYAGIPLLDTAGHPLGLLAVMHDEPLPTSELLLPLLTVFAARAAAEIERRRAEDQTREHLERLAHVARINTAGEMLSSIAHELTQPLTAIGNYASGAVRRLQGNGAEPERIAPVLEEIARQATRAGQMIQHLRGYIRRQGFDMEATDLNAVVRQAAMITAGEARSCGCTVDLRLDPRLPPARCDPVQIEQVVVNLVLNALQALSSATTGPRRISLRTRRRGRDELLVSVADTGPGLDPAAAQHLFQPFHSTKPNGLGLGLSISRSILEAHGGRLWAGRPSGPGAVFHFCLPPAAPHQP